MNDQAKVAVVGATGYAGYELARLLLRHPNVSTPTFFLREGRANVRCLTELYPQLRGWGEAPCKPLSAEAVANSGESRLIVWETTSRGVWSHATASTMRSASSASARPSTSGTSGGESMIMTS